MFKDLVERERENFLKENEPCLIPGYTGHCPTLKFRFGKRYGANTKDIIKEMKDKGISIRHEPYRKDDPLKNQVLTPILRQEGQAEDYRRDPKNRARRYILGYTGYIPGMNFRYGKSFRRAADDSVSEFQRRLEEQAARRGRHRPHSAAKVPVIRSRDDVSAALHHYEQQRKYKDQHISADFPPIAGYTGHIPRLKVTDASLSQRYATAARYGLALLQKEREKRHEMDSACTAVQQALKQAEQRYTIPAM